MKKIALAFIIIVSFAGCSQLGGDKTAKGASAANNEEGRLDNWDSIRAADSVKRLSFKVSAKTDSVKNITVVPDEKKVTATVDPVAKGQALIAASDCLTCHKLDKKLIGPAYQDVAKKYTEADVAKLAAKVISGGGGNWGPTPMIPHSDLSTADATAMVKYILSLK